MAWEYDNRLVRREASLRQAGFEPYCLFTQSGSEIRLAKQLNHLNESCLAVPFLRMKRAGAARSSILVQEALLKGYIFLFVPCGYPLHELKRGEVMFRILDRKENGGLLTGEDRDYAEWILRHGGLLPASEAIELNGRVRIISGPLLDLQGKVVGFSRRGKNYRIEFEMMGHRINTWLPFEFIEPAGEMREADHI